MSQGGRAALLPGGLQDLLPPEAAHEAVVVERLMGTLAAWGYERVKPPLVEFEETLLAGPGAALAQQTFRLMDPQSQRMLGLRSDHTPQIARIATARLHKSPRPLRLAYAGQVLRVKGGQLRAERQFGQVGVELIGSLAPEADAEVVLAAVDSLAAAGVSGLSVDLCVPTLVPTLCAAWGVAPEKAVRLRQALDRKDAAAVRAEGGQEAEALSRLITASGPADPAVAALIALSLPQEAEADRHRLVEVVRLLRAARPGLTLTVDLVEYRGFEYQTGVSFTLFAKGAQGELGAGGRYRAGGNQATAGEPATGMTLYTDTVLRAVPASPGRRRLYLPPGAAWAAAAAARAEGWATVAALEGSTDAVAVDEAARDQRCTHILTAAGIRPLANEQNGGEQ